MVHWWQDPEIEASLAVFDLNIICLLLGLYGWEYFQSLDVEYAVIRGRLAFRWSLVPYLVGRIFALTALLLLAVGMGPWSGGFACQPGITSISISGDIAIGASSANLMIRTWVIWKNTRLVHLLLLLLALGQWTILIIDATNIKSFMSNGVCVVYLTHPTVSAGVFTYTMCYDLLVLVLSIVKLSTQPSNSLRERLRMQGLLYFAVAAMANILPTVFSILGSDVMVGITGNTAITASTIVSCRAVRSLLGLRESNQSHTLNGNVENDDMLTTQLPDQSSTASVSAC